MLAIALECPRREVSPGLELRGMSFIEGVRPGAIATAGSRILVDGSDVFAVHGRARPAATTVLVDEALSPA